MTGVWTLFSAKKNIPGERHRAGVGSLMALWLTAYVLEFTPEDERVASLHLRVGELVLTVVSA